MKPINIIDVYFVQTLGGPTKYMTQHARSDKLSTDMKIRYEPGFVVVTDQYENEIAYQAALIERVIIKRN